MGNKFLDVYPQLRDPKVGDKVIMINSRRSSYDNKDFIIWNIGDIGEITSIYFFNTYRINFEIRGSWAATSSEFKLYEFK